MIGGSNALRWVIDRRHAFARGAAIAVGALTLVLGGSPIVDHSLRALRDSVRSHPASGEVHIVEIDARSLQQVARWPFPRRHHAELIDRLRAADVRSIAFDVDFSALSNPQDDRALADALQRADGNVILPTLRQRESSQSTVFVDNLPAAPFRDVSFLAGVNVQPDPDGEVRQMLLGIETDGVPRPSLATMVAEREAEIDTSFPIDYSIDPASIPRHSFFDILSGRVPASVLANKRVIIGATAVEIWDRYSVPNHGVIPGVVIQALAAETLLQGPVPTTWHGAWMLLLAFALILLAIRPGDRTRRIALFAAGSAAILLLPLATEQWLAFSFPLAPALAALVVAAGAALSLHFADRFRQRALTDRLTGLANLSALEADALRTPRPIVVAKIERFAALSAGLGPAGTTNLIHRVVDRLSFGFGHIIYRIDEATLAWIEGDDGDSTLQGRLQSLLQAMRAPVDCGRQVDVTLSFGIADPVPEGAAQQIANASLAAVHAARLGTRVERFVAGASEETAWHLSLLGELDSALADDQLWNAYQPKLDIASGRVVGVEALVRWDHPERGPIAPDNFIPLVEEHGRASDLTLHVLNRAIEDGARWHAQGHKLSVAVNVSATLLLDQAFVDLLRCKLSNPPLPVESIVIEVTESAAMTDPDRAIAALESWRALGLNISIDDYGTGQSSMGYLQKLPATELKIDKSFVQTIASDPRNAIMVRSTVAMAHELGMKVVAEGVEDAECLHLLAKMGCDTAQGWHIGKPMPAAALTAFMADRDLAAA